MTLLDLEIDELPPTVNSMYRSMRNGQRYKTKECREFQERITNLMRKDNPELYTGRASLLIRFTAADKRRWDIDNRVKAIQDCLILSGVLKDDCQIDTLHVERQYGTAPATYIRLDEYPCLETHDRLDASG